jgi:hypothetical protein
VVRAGERSGTAAADDLTGALDDEVDRPRLEVRGVMASTSASWIAKPGPEAPKPGITARMMEAIAGSSARSIGRRRNGAGNTGES